MNTPEIADMIVKPEGYYANIRSEMLDFIPQDAKKILDCGCGEGHFGNEAKNRFNAEVWGLEMDVTSAETAKGHLHTVIQGDLATTISEVPAAYFDCITFNDVLEHLVNPYEILTTIKGNLSPNGVVVCSIPNARYWRVFKKYVFGKDWKYEDNGVMDRTHLRFFTKKSMINMFEDLNYEVISIKGLKPTPSVGFHILNTLTLGYIKDCKYIQYACVARPKKES